MLAAPAASCAR